MRYIDFSIIDQNDPDVIAWVKRAKQCNQELAKKNTHVERKEFMKSNSIWQAFKPILIKYYGEKCWYSECDLIGSFADVDHFRPKNKSTDEDKNVILQDGYWWLAYDYLNYRLSCNDSNRSYGNGGKNDIFPLKKGCVPARVGKKDDIPILLDPCVKSDSELIDCNEIGEIISLSTDKYDKMRVDTSKKIYNCIEEIDDNEIACIDRILIIELKKGGFRIGRNEISQAEGYVESIYKGNKLNAKPRIKAFVIGDTIDSSTSIHKKLEEFGEVYAYTYDQLVRTAEKRLFNLKTKLEDHYNQYNGDDYVNAILNEPIQMRLPGL